MPILKDFKFLIIGLGSMGKRRIRNLLYHGIKKENIFGFDIRRDRNEESEKKFGIKTFKTFNNALNKSNPDVYIISTPADKHYIYIKVTGEESDEIESTGDEGESEILTHLNSALEVAKTKGDDKLIDQIGNTITFFTRQYIVK